MINPLSYAKKKGYKLKVQVGSIPNMETERKIKREGERGVTNRNELKKIVWSKE